MTDHVDIAIPIRPPHVEQRHARIELFRPVMLQQVAAYRFAAMQFEAMMVNMPDDDQAVDKWADRLRACQMSMVAAIKTYRQMRDIKGEG